MALTAFNRLCLLVTLLICGNQSARAGHDLFTQLVFSEARDTGLARTQSVTTVGIPLAPDTNIESVNNLVLVGSTETQFTVLNRWPKGSIRWLLLDSIIDIPSDAQSISLPLTTGQEVPQGTDIASEDNFEIRLNTGRAIFVIPKEGNGFLSRIEIGGEPLSLTFPFEIRSSAKSEVDQSPGNWTIRIDKNGPVTASVLIQESISTEHSKLVINTRLTAFRFQSHLKIEISAIASPNNRQAIDLPRVTVTAPFATDTSQPVNNSGRMSFHRAILTSGQELLWICENHHNGSAVEIASKESECHTVIHRSNSLAPGSIERTTIYLETSPGPNTIPFFSSPLIGRAASVETYNDGFVFHDKIMPTESKPISPSREPANNISAPQDTLPHIKAYLRAVNESYVEFHSPAKRHVEQQWHAGVSSSHYPDAGLAVWAMMTGDVTLLNHYLDWRAAFLTQIDEARPGSHKVETLLHLIDLHSYAPSERTRLSLLKLLEDWLNSTNSRREEMEQAATSTELIVGLSLVLQQGYAPAELQDRIYDRLESLLHQTPEVDRGERWHYEAYLISGNPEIIRRGSDYLKRQKTDTAQNLQHLIAAPLRYRVWRPLTLSTERKNDGDTVASWTVPPRAERYRFKTATRSISTSLLEASLGSIPFHQSTNLSDEPKPGLSGSQQSLQLPSLNGPSIQIAGRYLERGMALPAPDQESPQPINEPPLPSSSSWDTSQQLLQIAVGAGMVALILMWWKRKTSKITLLFLLATMNFGFTACSPPLPPSEATSISEVSETNEALSAGGNYRVSYAADPHPIPLNVHFEISVNVVSTNDDTKPITIEVSADMPAHGHGINTAPSVQDQGNGKFSVEGLLFHMKGDWELYVDIIDGPVRERAVFPITL